jgi:hypothetical protein
MLFKIVLFAIAFSATRILATETTEAVQRTSKISVDVWVKDTIKASRYVRRFSSEDTSKIDACEKYALLSLSNKGLQVNALQGNKSIVEGKIIDGQYLPAGSTLVVVSGSSSCVVGASSFVP